MRSLDAWLRHAERCHSVTMALGLDRVRQVAQTLCLLPPKALPVLVAGTNGKGTTVLAMEHLLRLSAPELLVGATLSPHLQRFNERVRMDGSALDDASLCAAFERVEAARGSTPLTYFEFATLVALERFAQAACDVVLLEIGLGGRLDAFNIVDAALSIVTSIDLDHQAYLGNTRETIGAEKAGVFRPGQRVLLGPDCPASVHEHAEALGVMPLVVGASLLLDSRGGAGTPPQLRFRADGRQTPWLDDCGFVPSNLALAWAGADWCLMTLGKSASGAAELTRWLSTLAIPGRTQCLRADERCWVLDVGHNPAAAAYLCGRVPALLDGKAPAVIVFGCFEDKDAQALAAQLKPLAAHWVLVPTSGPRGQTAAVLAGRLAPVTGGYQQAGSVEQGLRIAKALTRSGEGILVLGGFSVIAATQRYLTAKG